LIKNKKENPKRLGAQQNRSHNLLKTVGLKTVGCLSLY
jgi:hypothetical protein